MSVLVNGTEWDGAPGSTVAELVATWCPSPKGVAVARNGDVIPKSGWDATHIEAGDRIEIVTATAGG